MLAGLPSLKAWFVKYFKFHDHFFFEKLARERKHNLGFENSSNMAMQYPRANSRLWYAQRTC